ncbi:hypothetical protein TNCV_1969511 [Trichonephila clavipes]|nr:hypothetical protein TNCV_1969511 [Trichonephila clavipes]
MRSQVSVRTNISKRWNTAENDAYKNQSSADSAIRLPNTSLLNSSIDLKFRGHVPFTEYRSVVKEAFTKIGLQVGCEGLKRTVTAGSDVVQSERPNFDDFFQHLWPYIGNNTANVVFQMVKRLWLIRID